VVDTHGLGPWRRPHGRPLGAEHRRGAARSTTGLVAAALHTVGYLAVTALAAVTVYRWLGVSWLRTCWINLDLVWGVALIATVAATPFI